MRIEKKRKEEGESNIRKKGGAEGRGGEERERKGRGKSLLSRCEPVTSELQRQKQGNPGAHRPASPAHLASSRPAKTLSQNTR